MRSGPSGDRARRVAGSLSVDFGWQLIDTWRQLGMFRHAMSPLLPRIWGLRNNLSAYDASYVALAERLDCALVTADARLSRAPAIKCPITVMPSQTA